MRTVPDYTRFNEAAAITLRKPNATTYISHPMLCFNEAAAITLRKPQKFKNRSREYHLLQ